MAIPGAIKNPLMSQKANKQVTCKTEECDNKFIKMTPNHLFCKQCAADRQAERANNFVKKRAKK